MKYFVQKWSPSSCYHILGDHETEDRNEWIEIPFDDWHLELHEGDVVIEKTNTERKQTM